MRGEHHFKDGGMDMTNARVENRSLSLAAAVSLTLLASQLNAQEREETEEIVVTGSYIKRDTFDAPSPTEVIDSAAIAESGAPTIGNFIRDLTFTFEGLSGVTEAEVLGALRESRVNVCKECPYDPPHIARAKGVIRKLLAGRGWPDATVEVSVEEISQVSVTLSFVIKGRQ